MKLTVLGGGGVRSPFLAKSLTNKAKELGIKKLVFMDNDEEKLKIYGGIAKRVAAAVDKDVIFELTTDAEEAVTDANYIITTLRVGQDEGRYQDEKTAQKYGVLGQETTGAGGFAMSLRSIPVLVEYCKLINKKSAPGVIIFNFTNHRFFNLLFQIWEVKKNDCDKTEKLRYRLEQSFQEEQQLEVSNTLP